MQDKNAQKNVSTNESLIEIGSLFDKYEEQIG